LAFGSSVVARTRVFGEDVGEADGLGVAAGVGAGFVAGAAFAITAVGFGAGGAAGVGVADGVGFGGDDGVAAAVFVAAGVRADWAATVVASFSAITSSTMRGGLARIISLSRRPPRARRMRAMDRVPLGSTTTCSMKDWLDWMRRGIDPASREMMSSASFALGSLRSMR
jgi:hypothetical protein